MLHGGAPELHACDHDDSQGRTAILQGRRRTFVRIIDDPRGSIRCGTWSPAALGLPSSDLRHTRGPRTKIEEGESRRGGAPPGDCRSASADHRRPTGRPPPATATPAPPAAAGGRGRSKGRLLVRVRGNPNHTPPPLCAGIWANWAGRPSAGRSQARQPTGRTAPFVPEVRRTPLNFRQVQKTPLNFNLALRLLSFIYSDLLVL
jgi:hypothetical protein